MQQYAKWEEHTLRASDWFGNLRIIRWIPESFGQKRKDFGRATAESYVLIHLLYPLWGSLEFLLIVRSFQRKREQNVLTLQELSDSYEHSLGLSLFEWIRETNEGDESK